MEQKGVQLNQETSCSICLDLLKDVVTILCGHSYCMNCVKTHWDEERCICYLCSVDGHKAHDTVSAAAGNTEKQRELKVSRQKIQQIIQDREKDVKVLQQEVEAINHSADKAVEDSEKIFNELICLIKKRSSDVKQQVRSHQKTEVSRVKELQEKLEREITELKRKDTELGQLLCMEDDTLSLQNYRPFPQLSESRELPNPKIHRPQYFDDVMVAVSEVRDKLQDILSEKWTDISRPETEMDAFTSDLQPEPKTRAEFLQYSHQITLDPKTVNTQLLLSDGNRRAMLMREEQSYPSHTDRFIRWRQVLSGQSLNGRCYWEVEWNKKRVVVAVAYKNISRAGSMNECTFGFNNKSWALECNTNSSYKLIHNCIKTRISGPLSSRVGVYLDHSAGILSFYSVSETMTLLHRVQTTFTQPLHAGLWFSGYNGATAEFCELK